jgi:hypothetical protein
MIVAKQEVVVVSWIGKVKNESKTVLGGGNRWAVSTWIGLRLGSELSS